AAHRESGNDLAVRYFGTEALFVFDPCDDANRPPPGDPMRTWWPIYPGFFRRVFEQAFTAGLRDTSGTARVSEGVWRRGRAAAGGGRRRALSRPRLGFLRPGPPPPPRLNRRPRPPPAAPAGTAGRQRRALRGRRHHRPPPAPRPGL